MKNYFEYDVFISHASEDKDGFVRPLAEELRKRGYGVWYDEFSLTLGDSLRRSIDKGLGNSKYGIVVLSPNFLEKEWPQKELDGLAAREIEGRKVILPIWHNILYEDIITYSPTLADKLAVSTSKGLDYVVREIVKVIELSQLESNQVDLKSQNISLTSSNQFASPEILSSDAWILLDNKLFLTGL
nr:toll/interleukin-1 receptor domain-containing protein [Nostoc sp. EkiNYC01]